MSEYPYNDYRNYLMHYAKGETAKDHKYLYIDENGNYIYADNRRSGNRPRGRQRNITGKATVGKTGQGLGLSQIAAGSSHLTDDAWNSRPKSKVANRPRGRQRNITGSATVEKNGKGLGLSQVAAGNSKVTDNVWNARPKSRKSSKSNRISKLRRKVASALNMKLS